MLYLAGASSPSSNNPNADLRTFLAINSVLGSGHILYPSSSIAFVLMIFALRAWAMRNNVEEAELDESLGDVLEEGTALLGLDCDSLDVVQAWMTSVLDG